MRELINTLQARIDRIKYYGDEVDVSETLEEVIKEIDDVAEAYEFTQSDLDDAIDQGFERAKERIIEEILENASLKKRGEMIDAVKRIEWNG